MAMRGFQSRRRQELPSRQRDRVITIRQLTDGIGEGGEPVSTWTNLVVNMPASRLDISGQERFRSGVESASVDTSWEINYRADMDPELIDVQAKRQIVANGRIYDIRSARQSERRKLIELVTLAGSRVDA